MKSFIEQAKGYQSYHTKPITVATHLIGVPLVILSLMILIGCIKVIIPGVMATDLAWLLTACVMFYYFCLEWRLALATLPLMIVLLWIAYLFNYAGPSKIAMMAFAVTFVAGWIFQLAGHWFEGKRPAFIDNFSQSLIAPLFIVAEILFKFGFLDDLKKKIN